MRSETTNFSFRRRLFWGKRHSFNTPPTCKTCIRRRDFIERKFDFRFVISQLISCCNIKHQEKNKVAKKVDSEPLRRWVWRWRRRRQRRGDNLVDFGGVRRRQRRRVLRTTTTTTTKSSKSTTARRRGRWGRWRKQQRVRGIHLHLLRAASPPESCVRADGWVAVLGIVVLSERPPFPLPTCATSRRRGSRVGDEFSPTRLPFFSRGASRAPRRAR